MPSSGPVSALGSGCCCVGPGFGFGAGPPPRQPATPTRNRRLSLRNMASLLRTGLELHEVVAGEHRAKHGLELVTVARELRLVRLNHARRNGGEIADDVGLRHRP